MSNPETVICTFRVKPSSLDEFMALLERHWPKLRELGLVTDRAEQSFVSESAETDHPTIVSVFEWVNGDAAERAHEHPDVAEIWEAMEPLCESRQGRPSMEFPHFQPLTRIK
jgi:quinol monooxygenase YgiN